MQFQPFDIFCEQLAKPFLAIAESLHFLGLTIDQCQTETFSSLTFTSHACVPLMRVQENTTNGFVVACLQRDAMFFLYFWYSFGRQTPRPGLSPPPLEVNCQKCKDTIMLCRGPSWYPLLVSKAIIHPLASKQSFYLIHLDSISM